MTAPDILPSIRIEGGEPGRVESLTRFLTERGYVAAAPDEADVLVILDEKGTNLVDVVTRAYVKKPLPIVVFSNQEAPETIRETIAAGASAYVADGYSEKRVPAIIASAIAKFDLRRDLEDQLAASKNELAERKVIDRAKGIVMRQRDCGEEEAYAFLRKLAMDNNKRIADFAKDIVMVGEVFNR